jgi:hypothetical protein
LRDLTHASYREELRREHPSMTKDTLTLTGSVLVPFLLFGLSRSSAVKGPVDAQRSGCATKVLAGVSPCENPNEASDPRVRESVEPVLGGFIDPVFGLVLVLLRELLLEPPQRISARLLKCLPAPRTQDHFLSLETFSQRTREM